ncbi:putative transporter [Trypanosoma conorhini]|uniref:Putative transporter n=1 Tax=Trypanosoma conorhini TaxID=83891 RepID=A0A3R7L1V1_9TRYP|nr:putative transporter [Trypanosoma conorhini]RNF05899.1 putative transporter [Trypanosoma conorhini]
MHFAIFGTMNSFTVFLDGMMNDATLAYPSQTELSLGNSIAMGLTPVFGLLGGFLSDRFHPRILLLVAMAALYVSLLAGALWAKTGVGVALSFALPLSFAAGMMITPVIAATSSWFDKHQSSAIGLVFAGGGCGSLIFPLYIESFLNHYGWRTTFRFLTILVGTGVIGAVLVEKRSQPSLNVGTDAGVEYTLAAVPDSKTRTFRNAHLRPREIVRFIFTPMLMVSFLCQIFYLFSFSSAIYLPVPLALTMGKEGTVYHAFARIDSDAAGRLLTWFGIAQTAGAILSGFVSAHVGGEAVFCFCSAIAAIGFCLLALSTAYVALSFSVMVLAFSVSGMLSTYPAILTKIYHGANLGLSMSLVFLAGCVSGLAAAPVQSAMQSAKNNDYTYGCVVAAGCAVGAAYACYFFQWKCKYEVMELIDKELSPV